MKIPHPRQCMAALSGPAHFCHLALNHPGPHECFCGEKWNDYKPKIYVGGA